ncbi:Uncharacterised protein [Starkeya nomas]|uniref:Uncharacterized protein n=2 Tax=Starkeya nomas TaxID=2666134 RepID=A0A5S9Q9I0_9HYPH|nr:Uncharacterised protein [Starkeya nomas]
MEYKYPQQTLPSSFIRTIILVFCSICALLIYADALKFSLWPIVDALDPSWVATIAAGQQQGHNFGTDITFTVGPLMTLIYRYFYPGINALYILSPTILIISLTATTIFAFSTTSNWRIIVFLLTLYLSIQSSDATLVVLAVAFFMTCRIFVQRTSVYLITLLFSLSLSAMTSAKFSTISIVIPTLLLLDIVLVNNKRLPVATASYVFLFILIWILTGQNLSNLPDYLQSGFEVTRFYSEAMSITGPAWDLLAWTSLAIATGCLLIWYKFRSIQKGENFVDESAELLVVGAALFLSLKHGFVRHDAHSMIAWSALSLLLAWLFMCDHALRSRVATMISLLLLALTLLVGHFSAIKMAPHSIITEKISSGYHQMTILYQIITDYDKFISNNHANWKIAAARIRENSPLPNIDGTVDIIPNRQAIIIASGQHFVPRPTVQEHGAYSPYLIGKDRDFFLSDRAPKYLYMAPGSIDGRHPASAEGSLWPLFLAKYEVVDSLSGMLLLRQRPVPLENILSPPERSEARFNAAVPLPPGDRPLFVSLDIRKTLYGRLLNFFFKPPPVFLVVTYSDGSSEPYRLIPAMASEGMILSPTVTTAPDDYLALAKGDISLLRKPVSFTVVADRWGPRAYAREIGVSIASIDISALRASYRPPAADSMLGQRMKKIGSLISALTPNPPALTPSPEGVFAHAPASISLAVPNAAALELEFGIRDGAWQNGNATDGVCFSIRDSVSGDILFERCLDPLNNPADRHTQKAHVALPAGTAKVDVRTDCRQACSWDWSYWSQVEPVPAGAP